MEELDEKIKEADSGFKAKALEQSQKAEKKIAIKDVRINALELIPETKQEKLKQE